jgi:hypothetical protein
MGEVKERRGEKFRKNSKCGKGERREKGSGDKEYGG